MSRGPGRCQRRILQLLEATPEGRLSREELEVHLVDRRFKAISIVALPEERKPFSDDQVSALLKLLKNGPETAGY